MNDVQTEIAYAKINLALHVRARRDDGYHAIETLFAFLDVGDVLTAEIAATNSLDVSGAFADGLSNGADNLVNRALGLFGASSAPKLAVCLDKALPVASGIGGGSADAAAAIRLMARIQGIELNQALFDSAMSLGADVPACLRSETHIGTGTGSEMRPVRNDLCGAPVLLVNPRQPLSTGTVFGLWGGEDLGGLHDGTAKEIALAGRNDLQIPAIGLCPPISDVIYALTQTGAWLVRMSGSGATCFALYDNDDAMTAAQRKMAQTRPNWWTLSGHLR